VSATGGFGELERSLLRSAMVRLRARIMALVVGTLGAVAMFVVTAWLVVRGGVEVGKHLGLLAHYLPGYRVTWGGAVLGALYGFVIGSAIGWSMAWIYNRAAAREGA